MLRSSMMAYMDRATRDIDSMPRGVLKLAAGTTATALPFTGVSRVVPVTDEQRNLDVELVVVDQLAATFDRAAHPVHR
ncbi:MAG: hypothetical protein QOE48_2029 [Mycobacterium sp.]|jgi:hypothetical protein|nr:hypothetical protein [Mycobacterium sp.]